jgi:GH15 family glucan-1,4-alpha-glucosidase
VQFVAPEQLEQKVELPAFSELDARFEETREWWRNWSGKIASKDRGGPGVTRSAIVLKALNYAPTGAIIAAPTTSLPESLEGGRNWDYRFSWVRDSIFTVHALADLGAEAEADGFRRFIQRSAAGNADDLQVLYAIDGNRRLPELELDHLEGYRGIGPVRVGNRAERQFQADVYGLVVELAWRWAQRTNSPTPAYWEFLVDLINTAGRRWREPDEGIWETRSPPRHFVHSKVMCWVALERGIALAEKYRLAAPLERWQAARNGFAIRSKPEATILRAAFLFKRLA